MSVQVFENLIGKTMESVVHSGGGDDRITFTATSGEQWAMFHSQDCCEWVGIDDVCGDLNDLVGSPITIAEEVDSDGKIDPEKLQGDYDESFTWTFYRFATAKGLVTIRWYGSSNGYYSESVDFERIP